MYSKRAKMKSITPEKINIIDNFEDDFTILEIAIN